MDNWFATIVVGVGGIVATITAWLTSRKTARASEITAEAEAEQTVSESWKTYAAQIREDMAAVKKEASEKSSELQKQIEHLQTQQRTLEETVREQGERERRTHQDLEAVYKWIEDGMKPPAPERPIYLTKEKRTPWSYPEE